MYAGWIFWQMIANRYNFDRMSCPFEADIYVLQYVILDPSAKKIVKNLENKSTDRRNNGTYQNHAYAVEKIKIMTL